MPCSITITGRAFPCKTGIGGIKKVWAAQWEDGMWEAIAAGAVPGANSAVTFLPFELTKNSGSLQQTVTSSVENGTVFYSQVVTMDTASNSWEKKRPRPQSSRLPQRISLGELRPDTLVF